MNFARSTALLFVAATLSLGSAAVSQVAEPPVKAPPKPAEGSTAKPADQDKQGEQKKDGGQDAPKPQVDTTKQLQNSLDIAQRELKYLQRVLDSGGLLSRFKKNREITQQMLEKFTPEAFGPALPVKQKARLLGDGEKEKLAADVTFTVESIPVTQKEYDDMCAYLRSYPRKNSMGGVESQAILALVNQKAPQGMHGRSTKMAHRMMDQVVKRLANGDKFADVAKEFSEEKGQGAKGARHELVRDSMDENIAKAAFAMQVGQVSSPIAGADGLYVIRVLGMKRAETSDKDRVTISHIVRHYASTGELEEARRRIAGGQIDVAFRDESIRKFAPTQFQ